MKHLSIYIFLALSISSQAQENYTQFVNPFVGTDGHGHTFPGATTPFAMVQLSPDTRIDGSWDGCSGYHYSDSFIYGFSHTHLSGTGCSDYGDINFMPTFVSKPVKPITSERKLYYTFNHESESASPGYYSVKLNNGIKVELSASTRVGIQKYTYSKKGFAWITLDLNHRDQLLEGKINIIDKQTYSGFRRSKAWAEDQLVYFYTKLSKAAESTYIVKDSSGNYRLHIGFWVKAGESVLVKTALSTVDEEGAKLNLVSEMSHWDFQKVRSEANISWNKELNRIKAYGGTIDERKNFYTALYHCMIHPNILNDFDGRYRGRDNQIHKAEGFNYYSVFSLWDTYRALHPLLNIIDKKRSHDFIMTFKAQYEQSGRLPIWELWGNETNCMIGFHSVSVIWNAYLYGVISLDELKSLYPAVYNEAMSNRSGLDKFREKGFLSVEDEHESVSKTLEYAFNMYCVSMIALSVNNQSDAKYFLQLSNAWRNLRDYRTGFMVPRTNGKWIDDFDPSQVNNNYTEANAWQYSLAVQHNIGALGVNKELNLDLFLSMLFNASTKTSGREQADITGLIGQYAHGNEPSHHVAYLFNDRDSIMKYVWKICKEMYQPVQDGLSGNEDCGQMSAWYVFSAMGFYPANPSTSRMVLGEMLFDSVRFVQGDGEAVMYNAVNYDTIRPFFIQGKAIQFGNSNRYFMNYNGPMESITGSGPGLITAQKPFENMQYCSAPVLEYESTVFSDSVNVSIRVNDWELDSEAGFSIFYALVAPGTEVKYIKYYPGNVICIRKSCLLKAFIMVHNKFKPISYVAESRFYKFKNDYEVKIHSNYNKQYTAGGDKGVFDGLKGDADWRKGGWQGYQGQDFIITVDTKVDTKADTLVFGTLQDTRSWILFPGKVKVYGSGDSASFELIGSYENTIPDSMMTSMRADFLVPCNGKSYRYFKIVARQYGRLPDWHPGAGGDSFIFVDELEFR